MNQSRYRLVAVGCILLFSVSMGLNAAATPATTAIEAKMSPMIGLVCTATDGWWSAPTQDSRQAELVKIVKVQQLTTGESGLWVQPLRGPLKDYQFQIASQRIRGCSAKA